MNAPLKSPVSPKLPTSDAERARFAHQQAIVATQTRVNDHETRLAAVEANQDVPIVMPVPSSATYAIAKIATGTYEVRFAKSPGNKLEGHTFGFSDSPPISSAGFSVVVGAYDPIAMTVPFVITNASQAAVDLTATQTVRLSLSFTS